MPFVSIKVCFKRDVGIKVTGFKRHNSGKHCAIHSLLNVIKSFVACLRRACVCVGGKLRVGVCLHVCPHMCSGHV